MQFSTMIEDVCQTCPNCHYLIPPQEKNQHGLTQWMEAMMADTHEGVECRSIMAEPYMGENPSDRPPDGCCHDG